MPKKYDCRGFNNFDFFTINEVAEKLQVDPKTIRKWENEGLKIYRDNRPFYIHGTDIKAFLKQKNSKRRCKLANTQFYCCKCHIGVEIEPDSFEYEITDKKLGKNIRQIILKGKCKNCGTNVFRFSSELKLSNFKKVFNNVNCKRIN